MTARTDAENAPIWLRILERQGIATFFACVLLYGGWQIANRHLVFLDAQIEQSTKQTRILESLEAVARSNEQAMRELKITMAQEGDARQKEHERIMESLTETVKSLHSDGPQ